MKIVSRVAKIDAQKCVGCKTCERVCPTGAVKVKSAGPDQKFTAPCRNACPAGIDVPGYVALAGKGRFEDAYRLIRQNNPFPSVCGRVCTHPCELACNRGCFDQSVAIRDIKRFVADHSYKNGKFPKETAWAKNGKKVAIIGAGPSGLSCGYYLALSGFDVDVFESESKPGGVLLYGIPEYRLPKDILARDIENIEDAGVNIHCDTSIGSDEDFEKIRNDYDAVYIATGTQFSRHANIPGEDLPGVYHGLDFLRAVSAGKTPKLGKRVAIIGGGNTAIDVARTCIREGAEDVTILYRRRQGDMPADVREITEALEEGVHLKTMTAPVEFIGNSKVEKIRCTGMKIGEMDDRGRLSTTPITGSEFDFDVDSVIVAVSQYSDFPFIDKDEVEMTKWGRLALDENQMTTMDGVFAGGDVTRGSATAIEAIADGKSAAIKISDYLKMPLGINQGAEIELPPKQPFDWNTSNNGKPANLPIKERIDNYKEVALGLTEEQVLEDAKRCYRCTGKAVVDETLCYDCGRCWEMCGQGAVTMVPLEKEKIISHPLPTEDRVEKVLEICKKARLTPFEPACTCTKTTVEEIVNAILDGAHSYDDIAIMTGARTGCTCNCVSQLTRLLIAAGYTPEARPDGNCYPVTTGLWDMPEDAVDFDPRFQVRNMQKTQFTDEYFEQCAAMYRGMVAERSKKNE